MRVRVLFFGQLREIVGMPDDETEVPGACTVQDVFDHYARKFPGLEKFRSTVAASINQEYAQWSATVADGDELAFLPPVSGGEYAPVAADSQAQAHEDGEPSETKKDDLRLTRGILRIDELTAAIRQPSDGALVVFDGFVRNNFKGRQTTHLEYEAYEPMALAKIREIAAHMREKFPIDRIAIVHRLGRLEVGETSVLIAVTAPHRAAAFDACRYAIDTLKASVPIWKKEFFSDGSVWAEGQTPRAAQAATSATANFASSESDP